MNLSIFLVLDDEEDRFLLSLAFAEANKRKSIHFFPNIFSMIYHLDRINYQHFPDLIGINYPFPGNKRETVLSLLKHHPKWQHIPLVLFCHTIASSLEEQLLKDGAIACLKKASLYVDYRELPRTLIELASSRSIVKKIA